MTVSIISGVPIQAGPNNIVTSIIAPNIPGGGALGISDIVGLQAALDTKLEDVIGTIAPLTSNVTITGAELNFLSGLTQNVETALNGKVDLAGDTMTGDLLFAALVQLLVDAGSFTDPSIACVGDTDTGYFWPAVDTLGITVGGLDAFRILPSGLLQSQVATYETLVLADDDIPNKKYVDDEIALAIGGPFLPLAGGTMTGTLDLAAQLLLLDADGDTSIQSAIDDVIDVLCGGIIELRLDNSCLDLVVPKPIKNVTNPTNPQDAATKDYVDTEIVGLSLNGTGPYLRLSGADSMAGTLDMAAQLLALDADNDTGLQAAVDDVLDVLVGGLTVLTIDAGQMDNKGRTIANVLDPVAAQQAATKNYVDTEIVGLGLGGATGPFLRLSGADTMVGALDMGAQLINNLADPLAAQDAVTRAFADATYMPIAGGVAATGDIDAGGNKVVNVADPTNPQDAATMNYVDTTFLPLAGGTMTGAISMGTNLITDVVNPTNPQEAATKDYVDTEIVALGLGGATGPFLRLSGADMMAGPLDMGTNLITDVVDPTNPQEAATKNYVDTEIVNLNLGGGGPFLQLAGGTMDNGADISMGTGGQVLADDGTVGNPGLSFLSDDTTGMSTDGTNLRLSLSGTSAVTVTPSGGSNEFDVHGRKVTDVATPTLDGDAATKGYVDGLNTVKLLGSVAGIDLTSVGLTPIYTLPGGKMHIITHVIVRATSYNPGAGPTNPTASVGISGNYDQIVADATTLDWGGTAGAADQAVYLQPKDGASTPNSGETIRFQVDTAAAGTFAALTATVYVLGIEL